jgi:hypothetical protein
VHWGGEMGRLPVLQNDIGRDKCGRDHNTYGFSCLDGRRRFSRRLCSRRDRRVGSQGGEGHCQPLRLARHTAASCFGPRLGASSLTNARRPSSSTRQRPAGQRSSRRCWRRPAASLCSPPRRVATVPTLGVSYLKLYAHRVEGRTLPAAKPLRATTYDFRAARWKV